MTLHLAAIAAKDGTGTTITGGARFNDESGAGTGPYDQTHVLIDSTQAEVIGTVADAKNSATDSTPVSLISISKQVSASVQTLASMITGSKGSIKVTAVGDIIDGGIATIGAKADAASTSTDSTPISLMQVSKQVSASVQTLASMISGSKGSVKVTAVNDIIDGGISTIGAKADARSTSTDATPISLISIAKQISQSLQDIYVAQGTVGQAGTVASTPVTLPFDQIAGMPLSSNLINGTITAAMTGTAAVILVGTPGSVFRNYLNAITLSNTSNGTGTEVEILDGLGGQILWTGPAASQYGGVALTLPVPIRQPTLNTALYARCTVANASVKVSVCGFKSSQ